MVCSLLSHVIGHRCTLLIIFLIDLMYIRPRYLTCFNRFHSRPDRSDIIFVIADLFTDHYICTSQARNIIWKQKEQYFTPIHPYVRRSNFYITQTKKEYFNSIFWFGYSNFIHRRFDMTWNTLLSFNLSKTLTCLQTTSTNLYLCTEITVGVIVPITMITAKQLMIVFMYPVPSGQSSWFQPQSGTPEGTCESKWI